MEINKKTIKEKTEELHKNDIGYKLNREQKRKLIFKKGKRK